MASTVALYTHSMECPWQLHSVKSQTRKSIYTTLFKNKITKCMKNNKNRSYFRILGHCFQVAMVFGSRIHNIFRSYCHMCCAYIHNKVSGKKIIIKLNFKIQVNWPTENNVDETFSVQTEVSNLQPQPTRGSMYYMIFWFLFSLHLIFILLHLHTFWLQHNKCWGV